MFYQQVTTWPPSVRKTPFKIFDWNKCLIVLRFLYPSIFHVCRSRDVYDTKIKLRVYLRLESVPPWPPFFFSKLWNLSLLFPLLDICFLSFKRCFKKSVPFIVAVPFPPIPVKVSLFYFPIIEIPCFNSIHPLFFIRNISTTFLFLHTLIVVKRRIFFFHLLRLNWPTIAAAPMIVSVWFFPKHSLSITKCLLHSLDFFRFSFLFYSTLATFKSIKCFRG